MNTVIDTTFGNNTGAPAHCLAGTLECEGAVCSGVVAYRFKNLPEALRPENLGKYHRNKYGE